MSAPVTRFNKGKRASDTQSVRQVRFNPMPFVKVYQRQVDEEEGGDENGIISATGTSVTGTGETVTGSVTDGEATVTASGVDASVEASGVPVDEEVPADDEDVPADDEEVPADEDEGGYFDEDGNYYDDEGGFYDTEGYYFDNEGGIYDPEGGYYDPEGYYYDPDGNIYVFDEEGTITGYYDENGDFVDMSTGDDEYGVEDIEDLIFEDQTTDIPDDAVFANAPRPEFNASEVELSPDENEQYSGACLGNDCTSIGPRKIPTQILTLFNTRGVKVGMKHKAPNKSPRRIKQPGTGALMPPPSKVVGDEVLSEITLPVDKREWAEIAERSITLPATKIEQQMEAGYVRFQGSTSTCVLYAFCGLWYHEMRKIDPRCSYPSQLWMTAHITTGCGNTGGSNPTTSFNFASTIGMLPEGSMDNDPTTTDVRSMTTNQCVLSSNSANNNKLTTQAAKFKTTALPRNGPTYLFQDFTPNTTPADRKARLIHASLAAGFPVMIFMTMGNVEILAKGSQSIYTLKGPAPILTLPMNTVYHAVVLCGFKVIDGVPCFRLKNSWSIDTYQNGKLLANAWGDNGYAWLSAEAGGMAP